MSSKKTYSKFRFSIHTHRWLEWRLFLFGEINAVLKNSFWQLNLQLFVRPLNLHQFGFEDQSRAARNFFTSSGTAVTQLRWDDQLAFLALAHAQQSLVPALNHLTAAQSKRKRLSARNAAIEFGTVLERSLWRSGRI